MRFALEVVRAVRRKWPKGKPLFFRTSSIDGIAGGWTIEDTVALAKEVKAAGVDVIDCSAGGFSGSRLDFGPGYLVPFAARVRKEAGDRDAVGRLHHRRPDRRKPSSNAATPTWSRSAAKRCSIRTGPGARPSSSKGDAGWSLWPAQYGWWLERRAALMRKFNDAKRG